MNEMMEANLMQHECIENLILISAFGDAFHRRQALQELHQRKLLNDAELPADDFMTTLSVVF